MGISRPCIASKFLSLFSAGRPPLPWSLADCINEVLLEQDIQSVGVAGSLCPSVLTACGYDAPDRKINAGSIFSRWDEGIQWSYCIDDSPGNHPQPSLYLPVEVYFGEGAYRFINSEALFIDLPFSHRNVGAKWFPILYELNFNLIFLGFLQNYDGPDDVLEILKTLPFDIEEYSDQVKYSEKSEELMYRLIVAKRRASTT